MYGAGFVVHIKRFLAGGGRQGVHSCAGFANSTSVEPLIRRPSVDPPHAFASRVMLNCPPAPEEGDSHGHILMKTISERSCELVSIPRPLFEACPPYSLPFARGARIWCVYGRTRASAGRCDLIRSLSFNVGVDNISTRGK